MLHLLVGIDTEGDNQWALESRERQTFQNIYALPRLHELFVSLGVRPTYLVTYPVATDARSTQVLRQVAAAGDCEIGAHHHAWETPPCTIEDVRKHLYALQLDADRFEAQLACLTDAVGGVTGRRPRSYRSGRFGFSPRHVSALEAEGYTIESSVAPLFYERHKGGPDFAEASLRPYFLAYDAATRPGTSDVLELPISTGLDRRLPPVVERIYARAPRPYTTKRILKRLGILRTIWLRPSYSPLEDMTALAQRLQASGVPMLNVLFHSSEAIAGGSPYNRTTEDVNAFLDRLERFLRFAIHDLGAVPATFSEFRAHLSRHAAPAA